MNSSITIILSLYKENKISMDDAIQLIEDLYKKPSLYPYSYNTMFN